MLVILLSWEKSFGKLLALHNIIKGLLNYYWYILFVTAQSTIFLIHTIQKTLFLKIKVSFPDHKYLDKSGVFTSLSYE